MNSHRARQTNLTIALSMLLLVALTLLPMDAAVAGSHMQSAPAELRPLQLGEFVVEDALNGETFDYELAIPEDGVYETRIVDEDQAVMFDLVVTDANGSEVFNDVFGELELELGRGNVILRFEAVDNAELAFAVVGEFGDMSEDIQAPGVLEPGGVYYSNNVSEPLYAILTVFETEYPQQVTLYFEPGENDAFTIGAEGTDISYVEADSAETDLLRFYTHGGVFLVNARPQERLSQLTLIPFLSGAPDALAVGATTQGVIAAGETEDVFSLVLEAPYETLNISVESAAEDVVITMVDRLYDGAYVESSFGETQLETSDVAPGVYYVFVETVDAPEEDLPVSVLVTGVEGEAVDAPVDDAEESVIELLDGVGSAEGAIEGDKVNRVYWFEAEEAGALIMASLVSASEGTDFDLQAGVNLDEALWSTFTAGSSDMLSFIAPAAGDYYVRVVREAAPGDFVLQVEDAGPAPEVVAGELTWGVVEGGRKNVYRYDIPEAGGLLSVALVSQDDVTLDVSFAGYDENGNTLLELAGLSIGQADIVSAPIEKAGIYEVVVSAEFSDGGSYVLLPRMDDPDFIARQWASEATASTQYSDEWYSAMQAVGEPDTPIPGDYNTAWAPEEPDAGEETLDLTYTHSVVPTAVNVYETYNPGAIVAILAYDAENEAWVVLWDGEAEQLEVEERVFSPDIVPVDFKTDAIRIVLDTSVVEGWNEIDAVELIGRP